MVPVTLWRVTTWFPDGPRSTYWARREDALKAAASIRDDEGAPDREPEVVRVCSDELRPGTTFTR